MLELNQGWVESPNFVVAVNVDVVATTSTYNQVILADFLAGVVDPIGPGALKNLAQVFANLFELDQIFGLISFLETLELSNDAERNSIVNDV